MKLETLTIEQLKLELALHDKTKSIWKATMRELESRYQTPPDISNEPAIIEVLESIQS